MVAVDPDFEPLLHVDRLHKHFDVSKPLMNRLLEREGRRTLKAVDNVTFSVSRAETFAIVGESGCGKSTLARCIAGLHRPSYGAITFMGANFTDARRRPDELALRRHMQMIFQDPYASLNPRWRVADIIGEPLHTHGLIAGAADRAARVRELLDLVRLPADAGGRYPHQFSGGQRQRISIARALATNPRFIVCDEPTSALDVSVQAQILNLVRDLQDQLELSYLLISHDLSVVSHMAKRVAVMYLGRFVEIGPAEQIFARPSHPYTRLLVDTIPSLAGDRARRRPPKGEVPNPINPPPGCPFHPRCAHARDVCRTDVPKPVPDGAGTTTTCHGVAQGWLPPHVEAPATVG